jgi:hypothetical protein
VAVAGGAGGAWPAVEFNMGLQANPGDAFVWQSLAALEVRGLP